MDHAAIRRLAKQACYTSQQLRTVSTALVWRSRTLSLRLQSTLREAKLVVERKRALRES